MDISIIKREQKKYFNDYKDYIKNFLLSTDDYHIWNFQKSLRKSEIYKIKSKDSYIYKLLFLLAKRKRIILGRRIGITISEGVFDEGLRIYHCGNVVVNPNARVGKNCIIVGNLCIGNVNGEKNAPIIKDNVMLGWGSTLIGNIIVENNVKVAAGAVVVKNISKQNVTVAGIPAKIINN